MYYRIIFLSALGKKEYSYFVDAYMYVYIFVNWTMFTFSNELSLLLSQPKYVFFCCGLQDINNFSSVFQILMDFQNFHYGEIGRNCDMCGFLLYLVSQ